MGNLDKVTLRYDLALGSPDGLYNQELFDLTAGDTLLGLFGGTTYNPALNAIGFENSDYQRRMEVFLTYIGAKGTGAGTPTSAVLVDPCEPGQGVEAGGVNYLIEGWTKLRRSSDVRQLDDLTIKYWETQPRYTIAGQRIENDLQWDLYRLTQVILQDMQEQLMVGDGTNSNETDGFLNLISSTYLDPITGVSHPEMAGHVFDWHNNTMGTTPTSAGVTYNGNAVADGKDIIDVINAYTQMVSKRLSKATFGGSPKIIAMLPANMLQSLMEVYVCKKYCAGDTIEVSGTTVVSVNVNAGAGSIGVYEKRKELEMLYAQLGAYNAVTLNFNGVPITFYPYDYGLYNESTKRGSIVFLVPDVGNTPIVRIHTQDFGSVLNSAFSNDPNYRASDQGRFLWWEARDHTCYTTHLQNNHRVYMRARWLQMKITNIQYTNLAIDDLSMNVNSPRYLGGAELVVWS